MGIRSKAKKIRQLLPIVGAGGNVKNSPAEVPQVQREAARPPVQADSPPAAKPQDAASYIAEVIGSHPVTLFMKGSPSSPMCGFSANSVGILQTYGGPLHHVDVLSDPAVRQGIKDFSNWPTIPQIYIGGEFLGGSDILMQMHQAGELSALIVAARSSSK
jgi:monothiol glutaredoxin